MTDPELIMPFIVCTSQGGPYDDASFVAGWRAALIDDAASDIFPGEQLTWAVEPDLLPLLDLIAMRHGLTLECDDFTDAGDWVEVTMTRGPA